MDNYIRSMKHCTDTELVLITKEKLDINSAFEFIVLPSTGGSSCFVGTTRNSFNDIPVQTLFYEAYEPMALKELLKLCEFIRKTFNVGNICIMHRLGEVPVKEASVIIAISAVHRAEAIKATELGINELKARVPIWKKEIYSNETSSWKENKESFWLQK